MLPEVVGGRSKRKQRLNEFQDKKGGSKNQPTKANERCFAIVQTFRWWPPHPNEPYNNTKRDKSLDTLLTATRFHIAC